MAGELNMPFEEDPAYGTEGELSMNLDDGGIAGAVVMVAGVMKDHEIEEFNDPHPVIVFRFVAPDGDFYPDMSLVVQEDELRDLKLLVGKTIDGAINKARKERKRRGRRKAG